LVKKIEREYKHSFVIIDEHNKLTKFYLCYIINFKRIIKELKEYFNVHSKFKHVILNCDLIFI
jgi:spore coat polysaccharide biosynthesis predicted glycosyltransferase SpsG